MADDSEILTKIIHCHQWKCSVHTEQVRIIYVKTVSGRINKKKLTVHAEDRGQDSTSLPVSQDPSIPAARAR